MFAWITVCLDVSFMTCRPSVLAASSISAAASGLLGHVWCRHVNLLRRLHQLTNMDIVRFSVIYLLAGSVCSALKSSFANTLV